MHRDSIHNSSGNIVQYDDYGKHEIQIDLEQMVLAAAITADCWMSAKYNKQLMKQ